MTSSPTHTAADLRRQAEEFFQAAPIVPEDLAALTPDAVRQTLHELRVHQIELEMQNEELRTAQADLDIARAHYFDLYNLAPVGYVSVNEQGLILEANLTAATLLGVARGALVRQRLSQFILPDDHEIYYWHRKQLFATGAPQTCELRMVSQTGSPFWARLDATLSTSPSTSSGQAPATNAGQADGGTPICRIVLSDITAHKQDAENVKALLGTIQQERNRLAALIDAMVDEVWFANPQGDFTLANPSALREFCLDREQPIGVEEMAQRMEVFRPDGSPRPVAEAPPLRALRGEVVKNQEELVRTPAHGEVRCRQVSSTPVIDQDGNIIGSVSVVRDITERKQAEDDLAKSAARFRSYFDLPLHGIAITSPTKGWLQVNQCICSMLGYTRDEITRLTWSEMTHPDDLAADVAQFDQMLAGQIEQYQLEKRFIRKDGTFIWTNLAVGCVRNADGQVEYVVALLHDISQRKQAQADKEKLEAQNRQLQKSESLSRMAGAIAHHFNNQLMVVLGNLELVMEDLLPRGADPLASLNAAMQAGHRAAEVSSLMLTYLGQTPAAHVVLDLSGICRKSLPVLGAGMPKSMLLETDVPMPGPAISANANQIQQVLANLLTNAWEASKAGDVLRLAVTTVAAADIPAVNRFPIGCQPQGHAYACLAVTDTGCGIAAQDMEKLFDPFFSTKFTGRGLGLPVVLGIVRAHEGLVTVESKLGHGSMFRVFLPLAPVPAAAAMPATVGADMAGPALAGLAAGHAQTDTVLVVEDDAAVRHVAAGMLARLGFAVLVAPDGVAALALFRQRQAEIRCVLCDLSMPRMDGWATLTALRQLAPGLPVILASGYDEAQVMAGEHPERPQAFLDKPYQMQALRAALGKAMADN